MSEQHLHINRDNTMSVDTYVTGQAFQTWQFFKRDIRVMLKAADIPDTEIEHVVNHAGVNKMRHVLGERFETHDHNPITMYCDGHTYEFDIIEIWSERSAPCSKNDTLAKNYLLSILIINSSKNIGVYTEKHRLTAGASC